MEIFLDSTETKRIDLCMDYKVNTGETKERRFVVHFTVKNTIYRDTRSFESFEDAAKFYISLD